MFYLLHPPQESEPTFLDHGITPELLENLDMNADDSFFQDTMFDEFGEFSQRVAQAMNSLFDVDTEGRAQHVFQSYLHNQSPSTPDWQALRP